MERTQISFLLRFFAVLILAYLLVAWNPVNDRIVVPFTEVIAATSGVLLTAMGEDVKVYGTLLHSSLFNVNINNGCNGIEAMLILVAAILAYPARPRDRVTGLLVGALAVQILNAIRIISLYLLGAYQPRLFGVFHTAIWQSAVILAAIGFFLLWSTRVSTNELANRT
jgi:exosortase H (IPTLxxWG-CTERM-specific)